MTKKRNKERTPKQEPVAAGDTPATDSASDVPAVNAPKINAATFVRGKGPLGAAFLTVETMNYPRARRRTRDEWASEYTQFLAKPRN